MLPEDRQDTDIPEAIAGRSTGAYGRIFTFYEPCVRPCNCKITVQRVLKVVFTSDNKSFSFDSQLKGSLDLPLCCIPHSHLVRSLYLKTASHIQFLTKLSLLNQTQSRVRFNNYHFNTHRFITCVRVSTMGEIRFHILVLRQETYRHRDYTTTPALAEWALSR